MRASDLLARLIAGRSPAYGMAEVRRLREQGSGACRQILEQW